jgi:FkbM family methyltransferase
MTLRRTLLHHLAKAPKLYRWLLQMTDRGSVEKRHYIHLIRRGDTVFDVGANFGAFTVLFSDLVGAQGFVHSFEPVPPTFARLSDRIRLEARYPNIVINAKACSQEQGTAEITVPGGDLGQASMHSHAVASWATSSQREKFSVPTIRIDDYVTEKQLDRLDFIKCDAEGAELLVLKGATSALSMFEPLLHLEVSDAWTSDFGYSSSDLADFLEDAGYSHFLIEQMIVPLGDLRTQLAKAAAGSVNLLCATNRRADRLKNL